MKTNYGIVALGDAIMYLTNNKDKLLINDCTTFKDKLFGLMFKKNFKYGLKIRCNGIHTFFMKERIHVILTDKNYKVLYVYNNLKKNKIILPKKNVYYTFELPNNFLVNYNVGDDINTIY